VVGPQLVVGRPLQQDRQGLVQRSAVPRRAIDVRRQPDAVAHDHHHVAGHVDVVRDDEARGPAVDVGDGGVVHSQSSRAATTWAAAAL